MNRRAHQHLLIASLVGALCVASTATRAVAQDSVATPVFLTVSGGISKGSHQGGVNWALLRIIRRSEDSAFRARHLLPAAGLTLGGMTGASAGNINAVLTAMEWCRAEDERDPRQSLFWRIWIPTGFTDMLGARDIRARASGDGGLFDRAYFERAHLSLLQQFASGNEMAFRNCAVPVGITVTRRQADTAEVLDGLYVPVTRFATTFAVERGSTGALRFVDFARDSSIAHFGERIWLASSSDGDLGVKTVFDAVSASAAFPIAFAPQQLRYDRNPACRATNCTAETMLFLDGGVFDNNPVDLTIGIRRRVVQRGNSLTIYIDPDDRRGAVETRTARESKTGTSGVMQTAGEIVKAGRSAELYGVAKAVALDPASFDLVSNPLLRTNRRFAIVGAEFGAFGAFLGRPLRVFDFHVGLYDGLVFAAAQLTGDPESRARTRADSAARTLALIEDESLIAYATDRAILRKLWSAEFEQPAPDAPLRGRPREAERDTLERRVLDALLEGSLRATQLSVAPGCEPVGPLGQLYCQSKLPFFVDAIAADERVTNLVIAARNASRAAAMSESGGRTIAAQSAPFVDEDFARLIDEPQYRIYVLANRLIARLYYNEKSLKSPWAAATSATGMFLNQAYLGEPRSVFGIRDAWGLFDPSTIPRSIAGRTCLRCWAPYRVTIFPGLSGVEAEYRPTYRFRPVGVYASWTPWAWHLPSAAPEVDPDFGSGRAPERSYWGVGAGFVKQFRHPVVSAAEVGWRVYRPYRASLDHLEDGNVHAVDIAGQFLQGRIQFGVRYFPDNAGRADDGLRSRWGGATTMNGGQQYALHMSIPDIPGLLYWFLPR